MATTLIRNGCLAGALQGMGAYHAKSSFTPGDFAALVNSCDAIAAECITENALLTTPMADADNANIFLVCMASASAVLMGVCHSSVTAADYLTIAKAIVAQAKQSVAKLA